jgi:hypothetical protein
MPAPEQIAKGVAEGEEAKGPPVIVMATASELEQFVVSEVAVNVKTVVAARFTVVGSSIDAFTSCAEGDQL